MIKLVVGLANPGQSYAATRHNAGAWFIEALAQTEHLKLKLEKKLFAATDTLIYQDQTIRVAIPTTYMNESGLAVKSICQFYKIKPEECLIAHDELDLAPGTCRLKSGGGHGGHNGLRNIQAQLGQQNFHRLRIGIGHPGHKDAVTDYVLGRPSKADSQTISDSIEEVIAHSALIWSGNLPAAMTALHTEKQ